MSVVGDTPYRSTRSLEGKVVVVSGPSRKQTAEAVREFAAIPIAVNSVRPATTVASTGMMVAMGEDAVTPNFYLPDVSLPKVPVHR